MEADQSLGNGVYFAIDDYAGFLRRVAAVFIDSSILFILGIALWLPLLAIFWDGNPESAPDRIFFVAWFTIAWLYLTVAKRSKLRTVAYRILGIKIVTTKGTTPSLFAMTFRMLLWILGPFNFVLDLIWLGADSEQQSLRDCYAGTYVVRNNAEPIGTAPIHLVRYCGGGLSLMYPRVVRPKPI